jgi:hypothetical protein
VRRGRRPGPPDDIRRRLWAFYSWCADTSIPELTTLAETIETWWPAVALPPRMVCELWNAAAHPPGPAQAGGRPVLVEAARADLADLGIVSAASTSVPQRQVRSCSSR